MNRLRSHPNPVHNAFGLFFYLARIWENLTDRSLADSGITMRQLMLFIVIRSQFDEPPGIAELAARMGTSHQNTMAICRNLEKKGLLELTKDPKDRRTWRARQTSDAEALFAARADRDARTMQDLFSPLSGRELTEFNRLLTKLTDHAMDRHSDDRPTKTKQKKGDTNG